jgi:aryl-alcohol dehydrogenase-like predicted oxidoreductase
MKYNNLSNTGLLVSELCFGAMTFGGVGRWTAIGQQTQDDANTLIKIALDHGINFFDNANAYSGGLAEEIMGSALKQLNVQRDLVVIATKLLARMGTGANQLGLSRAHIYDSVDASLKRLQLDHIDLLYIHGVDKITPLEETMRGLEDVVRSGKVRYIGVCNQPAWRVVKANAIASKMGWTSFKALQYYYAIASRDIEHNIIPMAEEEGLSVLPWSPLAGGFLSGKFDRNITEAGNSRRDSFDFPPLDKEKAYDIIDVMREIANERSVSVAQVALKWVMSQKAVDSTIIGAKTEAQLKDNLNTVNWELIDTEMTVLNEISAQPLPYPNWMVESQTANRVIKFPTE